MNDNRITLRLEAPERMELEKLAKSSAMTVSSYIKKRVFDDNPEFGTKRKIYICPNGDKLNYIQVALAQQNQVLLLRLLHKEYGEEYKKIHNESYVITETRLAKGYNYKKMEVEGSE